ncbi:hypothetical protein EN943_37000 [Mesorhizobium sp. M7A.F.Ca.US.006.01.1.1]|uniref:hypothetical protein n=1 Tax=Mesorhizobium sp. M7A.F.Ca.US.006.01.1.1 TaxID=2496707 RepID=UPI000FC9DC7C|nr:hypothetical protein [Mesorhizobium sp. M7A.F.Ca.US.006.01.1.1]RUZ69537.1 hypothetical protein EN943_37000 [Mesorhizobium sp. M7A.F.Ca.US.006.01.1.1]
MAAEQQPARPGPPRPVTGKDVSARKIPKCGNLVNRNRLPCQKFALNAKSLRSTPLPYALFLGTTGVKDAAFGGAKI